MRTNTHCSSVAVQMAESKVVMMMTLLRPGRVTWKKHWMVLAPSILAASYSSAGITASPARKFIV